MSVELSDGDILLRLPRTEDASALYEAITESRAELQPWMQWLQTDYSITDAETWAAAREENWNKGADYTFAICGQKTGAFLGVVGLNNINRENQSANLGYWVRTAWTRRGVASTVARLLARYGLTELDFVRLELVVALGNHASLRAAEKTGALREGIARKRLLLHGQPHDAVIYSLVAEDFNLEK